MGRPRERSLWDALKGLWVRFLRVGVWEVPMWGQCGSCVGTPSGRYPITDFSAHESRGRAQRLSPSGFLLLCRCPSVSLLWTGV